MGALLITFLAVTAGIGTVAATAATPPRPAPRVLPSAGYARLATTAPVRSAVTTLSSGVRPGTAPHMPPAPPIVLQPAGPPGIPVLPMHNPQAAIVIDVDTHAVLWNTFPHELRATASLAKVMTVMVAMDHVQSLDQVVTVPPGGEDDNPDDSVMGLWVGDEVTIRDLIDGIWLASGDDAAETLSRTLIPRPQFVQEMNEKAAYLGMHDTQFRNPSGLDQLGEYSTAYDLALASAWLMLHYPEAFGLAGQSDVPLTVRGRDLTLRSLNKMVAGMPVSLKPYPGATGLKTGDTPNAGGCVIATAARGNHRLIAVVMGDDWFFTDAGVLLDYGFAVDR